MIKDEVINNLNLLKEKSNISGVLAKYSLNNLHIIPKLTPDEFVSYSFTSNYALNHFLADLQLDNFQAFCSAISLYLEQNLMFKNKINNDDRLLIRKFHNQILNSLELNYFNMIENSSMLTNVIEKFKSAHKVYWFTNKNSTFLVDQFVTKLTNVGFKFQIIDNYQTFFEVSEKITAKDVVVIIFDEYKNSSLVELAISLNHLKDHLILIAKNSFYELKRLNGLHLTIDYWNFPRISTLNARQFSLSFLLELLFQKIIETINLNHQEVLKEMVNSEN